MGWHVFAAGIQHLYVHAGVDTGGTDDAHVITGTIGGFVGALNRNRAPWHLCCLGCASLLLPPVRVHLSHCSPLRVEVLVRSNPPRLSPITWPSHPPNKTKMNSLNDKN